MFARIFTITVVLCAVLFPAAAKELKVLMIGNSFSVCVGNNLPQIVAQDPDNQLELTSAFIGGCTFERHYNQLMKAEKNSKHAPYGIIIWNSEKKPLKVKYYKGYKNKRDQLKEGTKIAELIELSEASDFTEQNIEQRNNAIITAFIAYLRDQGLLL